jgi:hypothetical protein
MDAIVKNPIYDLVKILNDNGIQVLEIDNEYFSISDFQPADKNTPFHIVRGKHITKNITDNLNQGLQGQRLTALIQYINGLPERYVQYSSHQEWKLMIQ